MSHERSWLETRVKAKAWGERYSLVKNVAEVACWGQCCDKTLAAKLNTTKLQSGPVAR